MSEPSSIRHVRLLVLDVDGVLTDGTVYLGGQGDTEIKAFHTRDGAGMAATGGVAATGAWP